MSVIILFSFISCASILPMPVFSGTARFPYDYACIVPSPASNFIGHLLQCIFISRIFTVSPPTMNWSSCSGFSKELCSIGPHLVYQTQENPHQVFNIYPFSAAGRHQLGEDLFSRNFTISLSGCYSSTFEKRNKPCFLVIAL